MPRLRALTDFGGYRSGEEFDATDIHARILCARDAFGGPKAELVDRAMKAREPDATTADKRRYLRRDMQAQK